MEIEKIFEDIAHKVMIFLGNWDCSKVTIDANIINNIKDDLQKGIDDVIKGPIDQYEKNMNII